MFFIVLFLNRIHLKQGSKSTGKKVVTGCGRVRNKNIAKEREEMKSSQEEILDLNFSG